jgi:hypothetical protein
MGEAVSSADERHLASCPACQSTLDQMQAVVATARQAAADPQLVPPPPHVWDAIATQLDLADAASPSPQPAAEPPTPISTKRSYRAVVFAVAAAVVGLLVGVVGAVAIDRNGHGQVVAQTALEPVESGDAHGLATLRSTRTGPELVVDLQGLPAPDGFYEVWLMNAATGGAVSLGSLDPGHPTTFVVPADLDLSAFPYVDVSLEPLDGNPAHSSDSVARGRIAT